MAKSYKRMSYADRVKIKQMIESGIKAINIAEAIGVHRATMYREIERGGGKDAYDPDVAQLKIYARM